MGLPTFGAMSVDWEMRVDMDLLRRDRLARAQARLAEADLGAFLCFDGGNIRYITATVIGAWADDKAGRFCLLPRERRPLHLGLRLGRTASRPPLPVARGQLAKPASRTQHGAMPAEARRPQEVARKIYDVLERARPDGAPDRSRHRHPPVLFALQELGLEVVDGQEHMLHARRIKTSEEIKLLTHSCMMVDAAYERLYEMMRPGVRENELRRGGQPRPLLDGLRARRGRERDLRRALQPASAQLLRPRAAPRRPRLLRHHPQLPGLPHVLLPHARRRRRVARAHRRLQALPLLPRHRHRRAAPGVTTADIARLWPRAEEFGFPNEEAAFALQYGHGVGLSVWEKPLISRLVSLDHPEPIEEGMVIALETFWPSSDGWSAARIEEQMVVTTRRLRGDHALPRGGADGRRAPLLHVVRRAAADPRSRVPPQQRPRAPHGGRDRLSRHRPVHAEHATPTPV